MYVFIEIHTNMSILTLEVHTRDYVRRYIPISTYSFFPCHPVFVNDHFLVHIHAHINITIYIYTHVWICTLVYSLTFSEYTNIYIPAYYYLSTVKIYNDTLTLLYMHRLTPIATYAYIDSHLFLNMHIFSCQLSLCPLAFLSSILQYESRTFCYTPHQSLPACSLCILLTFYRAQRHRPRQLLYDVLISCRCANPPTICSPWSWRELAGDPHIRVSAPSGPGHNAMSMLLVVVLYACVTLPVGPGVCAMPMLLVLDASSWLFHACLPCPFFLILPRTHVSAVINKCDGVLSIQRLGYMLLQADTKITICRQTSKMPIYIHTVTCTAPTSVFSK